MWWGGFCGEVGCDEVDCGEVIGGEIECGAVSG